MRHALLLLCASARQSFVQAGSVTVEVPKPAPAAPHTAAPATVFDPARRRSFLDDVIKPELNKIYRSMKSAAGTDARAKLVAVKSNNKSERVGAITRLLDLDIAALTAAFDTAADAVTIACGHAIRGRARRMRSAAARRFRWDLPRSQPCKKSRI